MKYANITDNHRGGLLRIDSAAPQCQCPECGCLFTNPVPAARSRGRSAKGAGGKRTP